MRPTLLPRRRRAARRRRGEWSRRPRGETPDRASFRACPNRGRWSSRRARASRDHSLSFGRTGISLDRSPVLDDLGVRGNERQEVGGDDDDVVRAPEQSPLEVLVVGGDRPGYPAHLSRKQSLRRLADEVLDPVDEPDVPAGAMLCDPLSVLRGVCWPRSRRRAGTARAARQRAGRGAPRASSA